MQSMQGNLKVIQLLEFANKDVTLKLLKSIIC